MVTIKGGIHDVTEFASDAFNRLSPNPTLTAVGGAVAGSLITGAVISASRSRKKSTRKTSVRRRTKARRKGTRKVKPKRTRRTPRTAGKRKDRSTKRIRMTKNGQPYIILKSGKARFIKKTSARTSRKRKGGRY